MIYQIMPNYIKLYVIIYQFLPSLPPWCMLTTIVITKETREQLKNLGKKGESYDQVLRRLLKTGGNSV